MIMKDQFSLSILIHLLSVFTFCDASNLRISIIAASQPLTKYFIDRFAEFQQNTSAQLSTLHNVEVKLFHTNFNEETLGDWTISPLLMRHRSFYDTQDWVLVCTDDTRLDLHALTSFLSKFSPKERWLIGHGLYDESPTIIHHFAFFDRDPNFRFHYPNRAAGYVMSGALAKSLVAKWEEHREQFDFRIDVDYEIAKLAKDALDVELRPENALFCLGPRAPGCVTWLSARAGLQRCKPHKAGFGVFFAVKTCAKFLQDRVPIIKSTWGTLPAEHLGFFAEIHDPSVPTIRLPVRNQEMGHCAKLREIFKWFRRERPRHDWLVIADDDTLLSVPKMRSVLACLDPQEAAIFGERYGYRTPEGHGYDYVTGGGSIAVSSAAAQRIVEAAESGEVRCQADDAPDDMALGMWAARLQIPLLHSALFHQARPADYPPALLRHAPPLTFHKFWNCDPVEIFRHWFLSAPARKQPSDEL